MKSNQNVLPTEIRKVILNKYNYTYTFCVLSPIYMQDTLILDRRIKEKKIEKEKKN